MSASAKDKNGSMLDKKILVAMVRYESVLDILLCYQQALTGSLKVMETAIILNNSKTIASEAHKLKSKSLFVGTRQVQ